MGYCKNPLRTSSPVQEADGVAPAWPVDMPDDDDVLEEAAAPEADETLSSNFSADSSSSMSILE